MRSAVVLLVLISLTFSLSIVSPAYGQRGRRNARRPIVTKPTQSPKPLTRQQIEQAMKNICAERARDPLGSVPIDEMQARPSLELNHPQAVVGAQRATRLLPIARELVVYALRQIAKEHRIPARQIQAAIRRVRMVEEIVPDPDLRDNAAVLMSDPHAIRFGTIFLVGLPSDEGMISVLAHELTHIADGRPNTLQGLFRIVGRRAAVMTGLRINGQKAEELTCDLVGVRAARRLVAINPRDEPLRQRLARSLEHNCVDDDDTDDEHLSPRTTMRAVLTLDPALAREIIDHEDDVINQLRFGKLMSAPGTSLTLSALPSYHHPPG